MISLFPIAAATRTPQALPFPTAGLMATRRLAARAPRAAPDTAVWFAMGVAVDEWDAFASAAAGEWEGFLVELDARCGGRS